MRLRLHHRARTPLLGGLITLTWANGRLSSITNRIWWFSRNSRRPGRIRVNLPGGFHGEIDHR